jgi:hypothetical protein
MTSCQTTSQIVEPKKEFEIKNLEAKLEQKINELDELNRL